MTSPPPPIRSNEYLQDPHGVLDALDANYLHPCSLDNMDIQHRMTRGSILGQITRLFSFMFYGFGLYNRYVFILFFFFTKWLMSIRCEQLGFENIVKIFVQL